MPPHHFIHPIEQESYAIIQPLIDALDLPTELIPLAARVLHATTDAELAATLCSTEGAVDTATNALRLGFPVITDVEMTRSGINHISRERTVCALSLLQANILPDTLSNPDAGASNISIFPSHTAQAMWLAAGSYPHDALYVIGCAPTALDQLLDMIEAGDVHPAAVIALPIGFVGAEEAKKRLMTVASTHSIPAITNSGPKGGSAATVACVNALYMLGSRHIHSSTSSSTRYRGDALAKSTDSSNAHDASRTDLGTANISAESQCCCASNLDGNTHLASEIAVQTPDSFAGYRKRSTGTTIEAALTQSPVAIPVSQSLRAQPAGMVSGPRMNGMLVIGHGTRSPEGVAQLKQFTIDLQGARPDIPVTYGLIEFAEETASPTLEQAVDTLIDHGVNSIVAVPLVLLGAGHMKDDGPEILRNARVSHPGIHATYARNLGIHPLVLDAAESSAAGAGACGSDAAVLVGRGSTDPDANSDLAKVARLLADGRGIASQGQSRGMPAITPPGGRPLGNLGLVESAFVSLAPPNVPQALDRAYVLGARKITVVPYFLFTGLLLDRIRDQAAEWSASRVDCTVTVADELWPDRRLAQLAWLRYDEALRGDAAMNCDCCVYRTPLPGYETKIADR
ncbi:MAG: precorrin-8X methylmutase [Acidimicrobiales bacterium]